MANYDDDYYDDDIDDGDDDDNDGSYAVTSEDAALQRDDRTKRKRVKRAGASCVFLTLDDEEARMVCQTKARKSERNGRYTSANDRLDQIVQKSIRHTFMTPVTHRASYSTRNESNPFFHDFTLLWPRWMLCIVSNTADTPLRFLRRVTTADLERTNELLVHICQLSQFRADEITMRRLLGNSDEKYEAHRWRFVTRILIMVVATRFIVDDIMRIGEDVQPAPAQRHAGDKLFRFPKGLFEWSVLPRSDVEACRWMYRLLMISDPAMITSHGFIPQHELFQILVSTVSRIADGDVRSSMCMPTGTLIHSDLKTQASLMPAFMSTVQTTLSLHEGLYVHPCFTLIAPGVLSALKSFICQKHLQEVLDGLPMSDGRKREAVERIMAVGLDEIFSHRDVLPMHGIGLRTKDVSAHRIHSSQPLFTKRTRMHSGTSTVGTATCRSVSELFRKNIQGLGKSEHPLRIFPHLPVGHHGLHTTTPGYEGGLLECFLGPIDEFCRTIWGPSGLNAWQYVSPTRESINGAGHFEFKPKRMFETPITEKSINHALLTRAVTRAAAHFRTEPWVDVAPTTQADIDAEKREADEVVDFVLAEPDDGPSPKRRRMCAPRAAPPPELEQRTREWHLGQVCTKITWDRQRRGILPYHDPATEYAEGAGYYTQPHRLKRIMRWKTDEKEQDPVYN